MILKLATILLMLTNLHCKGKEIDVKNYEIKKVKGIERRVTEIDFDVRGNTYVRGESTHLYVLDPKNEKLLYSAHENYAKAIVTTGNFTYIVLSDSHRLGTNKDHIFHKIHRMRLDNFQLQYSGVTYHHVNTNKKYHDAYCISSENILFFNGGPGDLGFKFLKPDAKDYSTVNTGYQPFYFQSCEEQGTQKSTIWFYNTDLKALAYLTYKETLNPSPELINFDVEVLDVKFWNGKKMVMECDGQGLYTAEFFAFDGHKLASKYDTKYYFFDRAFSQRFYVIEDRYNGYESYFHYTNESQKVAKIDRYLRPSIVKDNKHPIYVEDKHGTAFMDYRGPDGYQRLLVLKTTGDDKEWEEIFLWERNIYDLAVDHENNIWLLLSDGLYIMNPENPKYDLVEIKTEDIDWELDRESFLKVKKTNEIYIATKNGVFIASKKQTQRTTSSP